MTARGSSGDLVHASRTTLRSDDKRWAGWFTEELLRPRLSGASDDPPGPGAAGGPLARRIQSAPMELGRTLVEGLRTEGVDHIFLVPGGLVDPLYPVLTDTEGVRPIVAAHEAGAAFMADGYARAS